MKVDEARHRLFVAGGPTGRAFVYDTKTGRTLAKLKFARPGKTLVNDVVITRRAAYFTETLAPRLYKVPIAKDGSLGRPRTIAVKGPASATGRGFGLNGIDATPDGHTLIVDHTRLGALFTVDPRTGQSRRITIRKGALKAGTLDGLLLDGKDLWVVENFANTLAKVRLSPDLKRAKVTTTVKDPLFRVPATVAEHDCELALVNTRFDLGLPPPFGPGAPKGTDFDVVVLKKP
jgi:sugar lactone lactonase YvrE